jgi:hypothetical protein
MGGSTARPCASLPAERLIRLTARMYECRDTMRFLLRDGYVARMAEIISPLLEAADRDGRPLSHVVLDCARQAQADGNTMLSMQIVAAWVEWEQPSQQVQP